MVTAGQARRLGVSRVDLNRLVNDETLERVAGAARVYRMTGAPEHPDLQAIRAAWLQLGGHLFWHEREQDPDAVVSHRSAAFARGLGDLIPQAQDFQVATRRRLRRSDLALRIGIIRPGSWEMWRGLPVTTTPVLIQDLLADCEDESGEAGVALDATAQGLIGRDELESAVVGYAKGYGHSSASEFVSSLLSRG